MKKNIKQTSFHIDRVFEYIRISPPSVKEIKVLLTVSQAKFAQVLNETPLTFQILNEKLLTFQVLLYYVANYHISLSTIMPFSLTGQLFSVRGHPHVQ